MKPKRNVWLMYAIALLQGMVFYGPIATLYRQSAGVTIFEITIIESISLALCLLLELPGVLLQIELVIKKPCFFAAAYFLFLRLCFGKR